MRFFRAYFFLAAPSPLSLLLFKLELVSIGISSVDFIFFSDFLGVGDAGDADFTGVDGVFGVAGTFGDAGVFIGSGVAGHSGGGGALVCF